MLHMPSQGSLLGYSVDETNAEWTIAHLKEFLLELSKESGATSINVVAHSMGNRPMAAAMQQISWELPKSRPRHSTELCWQRPTLTPIDFVAIFRRR